MSTIRFINPNETEFIYEMFSVDPSMVGVDLTKDDQDKMVKRFKTHMEAGSFKIAMEFDDQGSPQVMYTGLVLQKVQGWWVSATKIKQPTNHFAKSAKIMAPCLDFMLDHMEQQGFYKFWMGAPEVHHNIRNTIMNKYSKKLPNYIWFDEMVIPRGCEAGVEAFDYMRKTCHWSDITIRMFVLDQKHRVEYLQQQGHQDYKGTILNA